MEQPPAAPPAPPSKTLHPMMASAFITGSKGAALAHLVKNGYLKECFTLGQNYSKEGNWKLQCLYCQKDIATGEGRTQNVLMHLARQHLDSISVTVLREIVKSNSTQEKEEKITPLARLGFESSGVKRHRKFFYGFAYSLEKKKSFFFFRKPPGVRRAPPIQHHYAYRHSTTMHTGICGTSRKTTMASGRTVNNSDAKRAVSF